MITSADIRDGINRGEFFLEYLPTMSLSDGRCLGAEALIRWRQPTGVVLPDEFIPLAEGSLVSGFLTYWVVDTVGNDLGAWLGANREAYVGINVPPEVLGRGGMAYIASRSGLMEHASQVMLEITERGVPDALGLDSIQQRGGLGSKIALDDVTFGSGASLAILARAHFDAIKFDKSLIDQITPESSWPDWLRAAAALVDSSQLMLVAEGVETEYQFTVLRAAGIHAAQGFYFSRPIPAAEFMTFYRDHQTAPSATFQAH